MLYILAIFEVEFTWSMIYPSHYSPVLWTLLQPSSSSDSRDRRAQHSQSHCFSEKIKIQFFRLKNRKIKKISKTFVFLKFQIFSWTYENESWGDKVEGTYQRHHPGLEEFVTETEQNAGCSLWVPDDSYLLPSGLNVDLLKEHRDLVVDGLIPGEVLELVVSDGKFNMLSAEPGSSVIPTPQIEACVSQDVPKREISSSGEEFVQEVVIASMYQKDWLFFFRESLKKESQE